MNKYAELLVGLATCYIGLVGDDGLITRQIIGSKSQKVNDPDPKAKYYIPLNDQSYKNYGANRSYSAFNVLFETSDQRSCNEAAIFLKECAQRTFNDRIVFLMSALVKVYTNKYGQGGFDIKSLASELKASVEVNIPNTTLNEFFKKVAPLLHLRINFKRYHREGATMIPGYASLEAPLYLKLKEQVKSGIVKIDKIELDLNCSKLYIYMIESLFPSLVEKDFIGVKSTPEVNFAPSGMALLLLLKQMEENTRHLFNDDQEFAYLSGIDRTWIERIETYDFKPFISMLAKPTREEAPIVEENARIERASTPVTAPVREVSQNRVPQQQSNIRDEDAARAFNSGLMARDFSKPFAENIGANYSKATADDLRRDEERINRNRLENQMRDFFDRRHRDRFVIAPDGLEYETDRDGYVMKNTGERPVRRDERSRDDRDYRRDSRRDDYGRRDRVTREDMDAFFDTRFRSNARVTGPDGRMYDTDRDGYPSKEVRFDNDDDDDRRGGRRYDRDRRGGRRDSYEVRSTRRRWD